MPARERLVAGLRCSDVLAVLSDYIDGVLDPPTTTRVDEHLRGCDWCEKFGGRFAGIVETLRLHLGEPEPLPADIAARLRERLRRR